MSYQCECRSCEGKKFVSYSTIRRHASLYGWMEHTEHIESSEAVPAMEVPMQLPERSTEEYSIDGEVCYDIDDVNDDNYEGNIDSDVAANDDEAGSSSDDECDEADDEVEGAEDDNIDEDDNDEDVFDTSDLENDSSSADESDTNFVMRFLLTLFFRIIHHFNISSTAASRLLTFVSFTLGLLLHPVAQIWPKTLDSALHYARVDRVTSKHVYVVCPREECNSLYPLGDAPQKCPKVHFRKRCDTSLGYYANLAQGRKKWKPFKTFEFIPPSLTLKKMFNSSKFNELLDGPNAIQKPGIIQDFQDGQVWKNMSEKHNFFTSKYHIGLMLSVDWFSPFQRSEYKVAAILLTVMNLPREERFKKQWTILAGIIPGPHEPPSHINNYLQPLVEDLLHLWNGIQIFPGESDRLRAALIAVSADLPALRKVTQFLGHKADLGCSRCKFKAEREPGTRGASGHMSYYTATAAESRNHEELVNQGAEYSRAQSKTDAAAIAQRNGFRFTQLLRLPYFDMVKMTATDPMHSFLLGLVKRETELNLRLLVPAERREFIRRLKSIKMPSDVGRLPTNIFDNTTDGVSTGVTANQWKAYITTYARPCMFKLLPKRNYESLVLLAQIVSLVISPVLNSDMIEQLYRLLQEHHVLFRQVYGKWAVTVNYHMCLHLPEMITDLGPPHSFWCLAYERVNGILMGMPNSGRVVEAEVANRFLRDQAFSLSNAADVNISAIPSSLQELISDEDDFAHYPHTFWVLSLLSAEPDARFQIQQDVERGLVDNWPLNLKAPRKLNVKVSTAFLAEISAYFESLYGSDLNYVRPRITKHGRCEVNGMKFSSQFNRTERGSVIKVMFVDTSNELTPYFGIVKFYFTVTVLVKQSPVTKELAYVTWLKLLHNGPERQSKLYKVSKNFYKRDRLISPRRFLSRCVLVSTKPSEPYFLVSEVHE